MYTYKKDIITISGDTLRHFKKAKSLNSRYFKIQFIKSPSSRLGILIPKKLLSLAVSRNALRRSMRGYFRSNYRTKCSYDILAWVSVKIQAEKKAINDILLPEWKSLLDQLL